KRLDVPVCALSQGRPRLAVPLRDMIGGFAPGALEVSRSVQRRAAAVVEDGKRLHIAPNARPNRRPRLTVPLRDRARACNAASAAERAASIEGGPAPVVKHAERANGGLGGATRDAAAELRPWRAVPLCDAAHHLAA